MPNQRLTISLFATDAERICYTIDVIKPRSNQGNLQNSRIIVTDGAKFFVMRWRDFSSIFGNLHDKIAHHQFSFGNRSSFIIVF